MNLDEQIVVTNQSGGLFGKSGMTTAIRNAKRSETNLISKYEDYEQISKKYSKAFDEHIDNLKKIDDYGNFKGLETLFKNVIMKDEFKKPTINKQNPLLFKNYPVTSELPPSMLRKKHILQQVKYVMEKYFAERDRMFVKSYDIELGKNEFILYVITIDNSKKSRKLSHDNYIISISETKHALKDILSSVKKHLRRKSIVVEVNGDKYTSIKVKSSKSSRSSKKASDKSTLKWTMNKSSKTKKSKTKSKTRKTGRTAKNLLFSLKKDKASSGRNISLFMTTSEKKAKKAKAAEEAKAKMMAPQVQPQLPTTFAQAPPQFAPALPQTTPAGLGEKAADLLATPQGMVVATAASNTGENDPVCGQHKDYESCKANPVCFFKDKKCNRKAPRPQGAAPFGAAPFGAAPLPAALPAANPFAGQQAAPTITLL
jgi:hypothetical protein